MRTCFQLPQIFYKRVIQVTMDENEYDKIGKQTDHNSYLVYLIGFYAYCITIITLNKQKKQYRHRIQQGIDQTPFLAQHIIAKYNDDNNHLHRNYIDALQ